MKGGEQKQFQCTHPGCDKVFNRRDYLERHATNHLPVKPFVCIQCDRHFSRKDLFDNHLSTKRHARVANEVEHNIVAAAAMPAPAPDSSMYLSDEFDDSAALCSADVPLPQRHDGYAPVPAQMPDLASLGQISPGGVVSTGPGLGSADHNQGYFDYSLNQHHSASAWELEEVDQGRRHFLFLQQRQQDHKQQQHLRHTQNQHQQQQQRQSQHQQQYHIQQRLQHEHIKQQEKLRRQQQHQLQAQSQHDSEVLQRQQAQDWDQRLQRSQVQSGMPRDARGPGLRPSRGMDSPEVLSGLMSWTSAMSLPERRSSSDMSRQGSNGSTHNQSMTASELTSLRSPTSESAEEATIIATLEQLIAEDAASTDRDAFADLREALKPQSALREQPDTDLFPEKPNDGSMVADGQANAITRVDGDSRYAWFFDDSFDTDKSKYGYDLCYSEAIDTYASRASMRTNGDMGHGSLGNNSSNSPGSLTPGSSSSETVSSMTIPASPTGPTSSPRKMSSTFDAGSYASAKLHPVGSAMLVKVLQILPGHLQDDLSLNSIIRAAWKYAADIGNIVHRPTFDANTAHPALLSVMILIGLALTDQREAAQRIYPSAYMQAYKALREIPIGRATRVDQSILETLQAFCLLLRYESLVLGSDVEKLTFTKGSAGRYVTDRFLWCALSSIPHSNEFTTPFANCDTQHQPIWSTSCSEAFLFHQGAEPDTQWREWALLESARRTAHLATYCDGVRTFVGAGEVPVSLFNLDIHMVSSDDLWTARTADQYFFIAGPSGALTTVPYLGLIKALIRFPRVAQRPGEQDSEHDRIQGTPWPRFALQVLAHGLISIVGRLSGLYSHEHEMLEAVVNVRGVLPSFDNRIQARLYRGLDVWVQNFSARHGPVCEQPFSPAGSGPVPQYAMLIMLCHYASFIYVHEDVPIVRQVTANLKTWIETQGSGKSLEMLDYLYMPLYVKWIKTDESKSIVSTSALYLAWMHAVTSQVPGRVNYLFLSAMVYISTIAVWLFEFASKDTAENAPEEGMQEKDTLRLANFQFMDDAIEYLSALHSNVANHGPVPKKRSVHSVIMLSACMLHKRFATGQLVDMLVEILNVMDPSHSKQELIDVVKSSTQVYQDRLVRAIELRDAPHATSSSSKSGSQQTDLESEIESDIHMSDVEMSNQFLSPSVGHAMLA